MGDTGGMRIGLQHPLEEYLLRDLELDPGRLYRLAYFLLAHAFVDRRLIGSIVVDVVRERGGVAALSLDKITAIADEVAKGTFGTHLATAKERRLVTSKADEIATELNRARNAFLHWERDRFSLPHHFGQDVTQELGFHACLDDVLTFMHETPWKAL